MYYVGFPSCHSHVGVAAEDNAAHIVGGVSAAILWGDSMVCPVAGPHIPVSRTAWSFCHCLPDGSIRYDIRLPCRDVVDDPHTEAGNDNSHNGVDMSCVTFGVYSSEASGLKTV